MKKIILLCSSLCFVLTIFAQGQSKLEKDFTFDNESDEKEISFSIHSNIKVINFQIKGEINLGILQLTILDPRGKKEGGFELEAIKKSGSSGYKTNSTSDENTFSYSIVGNGDNTANGSMSKTISKPLAGTWKVKISAKKLKGKLIIQITQM